MRFIHKSDHFFALNRILFPANEEATLKTKQPIRFQDFLKVTTQIAGKWETKSIIWQILQLLLTKFLLPPPTPKKKKNWMNLISDPHSTESIKYLTWPSPVFGRFENGCNKVVIEPRVMQFWSEIVLVISNRTQAQIALHSVQLPLWIKVLKWNFFMEIVPLSTSLPQQLSQLFQCFHVFFRFFVFVLFVLFFLMSYTPNF